jgi:hypothetical protein
MRTLGTVLFGTFFEKGAKQNRPQCPHYCMGGGQGFSVYLLLQLAIYHHE